MNVARVVRRVGQVVGGTVTCDLPATDGVARVELPFTLVLRRGTASFSVEIGGRHGAIRIDEGVGNGRFAVCGSEVRRRVVDAVGDAARVAAAGQRAAGV